MALNRAKVSKDIGLSTASNGFNFVIPVDYFDIAAPSTILASETFSMPVGITSTELQNIVIRRGQEIRTALAQLAAAQTAVPNGTTVTVP